MTYWKKTELHTDASKLGFGAVLLQKQDDGKFHPIAYFSKTSSETESKLHSFELETLAIVYALERFRTQLGGIHFVIVTDCNALTQAIQKKQVNMRIAKWVFLFENYNFSVRHRSGISMGHVDALSRCCVIDSEEIYETDLNIQITQNRDMKIKELRIKLENGTHDHFDLVDGIVFRKEEGNDRRQMYVPVEMENNIIPIIHEKIGHLGVDKTVEKLRQNYWFPKLRKKVVSYIKNCAKCIIYSPSSCFNEHNLYCIPKEPIPFHTIHVDHFGPLPSIRSVRKHVLVVIDGFTKHVKLYPVKSVSSKEVCMSLQKYFDNFSRQVRIIIDRGTCFTSVEFSEFLSQNNINHVKISVASPQANGQVERVNRILKSMLAKLTEPVTHADWVSKLVNVEYALNNTIHATTHKYPSVLLFGVKQRGRIVDELTEFLEEKTNTEVIELEKTRLEALANIEKSQKYCQTHFLKHSIPAREFQVGDFVVMENFSSNAGQNKKLLEKYKGPYIIKKKLPHDRYVITDIEPHQITQKPYNSVVESRRLRLWIMPNNEISSVIPDIESDI
ncbi:Transposon Tf2-11 polyprotein [Lucilia cuprina]|nr:Transposon Tf2-11 polyprotein [Lucilia cuprina]